MRTQAMLFVWESYLWRHCYSQLCFLYLQRREDMRSLERLLRKFTLHHPALSLRETDRVEPNLDIVPSLLSLLAILAFKVLLLAAETGY
jgi:hypothetical protein